MDNFFYMYSFVYFLCHHSKIFQVMWQISSRRSYSTFGVYYLFIFTDSFVIFCICFWSRTGPVLVPAPGSRTLIKLSSDLCLWWWWGFLLIIIIFILIIPAVSSEVSVSPSVVRRPSCRFLLGGDQVNDGRDDSTVFGLQVFPIHWRRRLDFVLQQRVQLLLQVLQETEKRWEIKMFNFKDFALLKKQTSDIF